MESLGLSDFKKSFDWETLNRLHEKGLIKDPVNKTKSIVFTKLGLQKSEELFKQLFTKKI